MLVDVKDSFSGSRRQVKRDQEYLYTVAVRNPKSGKFEGRTEKVLARGIAGVALQLKVELDDITYLTKEKAK